jgi:competence protein ComEC
MPLLPAAVAVTLVALVLRESNGAGGILAIAVAGGAAALAAASVDMRRLVWSATALAVACVAAHAFAPLALVPPVTLAFELPRDALASPLRLLVPTPESALLLGIVLGERADIPAALSDAFKATGTTHLLAISGFNMTLVAAAVALALRGRVRPAVRAAFAVAAIVAYSLLVGLSPSVLRAALMASVAAVGIVTGRRAATANALCAAVIVMLVADPGAVADLGFQLSALATGGLVLWQGSLAQRFAVLPAPVREAFATTLAATAPTLPVVAGAFGRISLVSPLANLVCVPMFPLLMLAGAATSVAGALAPDVARPVALLAWASALALRIAVETFAALPFASIDVPAGVLTGALAAALELGALALVRRVGLRRAGRALTVRLPARHAAWPVSGAAVAVLAAAVAVPAAAIAWPAPPSGVRVLALDVGQGDAYLVDVAGAYALIDGGPDPARLLDQLGATLPPWHRRIDVVALTHAHTDHGAGLLAVLERYEVGLAIEPVGLTASPLTDLWSASLAKHGTPRRALHAGQRVRLGDAVIAVLAPTEDLVVDVPSLVMRVERGSFSALFTGDAVDDALGRLLERPERLPSRVYIPPHHGAETRFAASLRAAIRPDVALISVGAGNRYGHPTPQTLEALGGVPTYRTDKDGTVEIALDGTGLGVRTHANALSPPRRGSIPYTPSRQ